MASIDTHGLNIVDLKKASAETRNYGAYSDKYDEIFYDMSTGEVWTKFQVSIGHNSWTEYHDENIIKVCETSHHMSMQAIADAIWKAVEENKH